MSYPYADLGSVAQFINGFAFQPSHWESEGKKIIRIQNLTDKDKPYNRATLELDSKLLVTMGDLLVSWSATLDVFEWMDEDSWLNQHIFKVEPDYKKVDKSYLKYVLRQAISEMMKFTRGSTMKHINRGDFLATKIPLPPLETQKQIAAVLEKADQLRKDCRRVEQELNALAQSVFLEMFGDPRGNPYGYSFSSLGELIELDARMVDPKKEEYQNLLHIGPDRIERDTGKLLPALSAGEENLISGKFLFNADYVLYSKIRPYLKKAALPNFQGLCSADMYPIKPKKNKLTREYLWALLLSDAFLDYTETLASRANIPKLNRTELNAYIFPVPPIEQQVRYSHFLAKLNEIKITNEDKKRRIDELFNAFIQQAFKGELDFKEMRKAA